MLPASLIAAAGMALAFIPSLGTAISAARPEEGGLAAGIVNTSYQVGSALGLAVMTAVASCPRRRPDREHGSASRDGYSAAFLGAAVVAAAGAVLASVTLQLRGRPARRPRPATYASRASHSPPVVSRRTTIASARTRHNRGD